MPIPIDNVTTLPKSDFIRTKDLPTIFICQQKGLDWCIRQGTAFQEVEREKEDLAKE